MTTYVTIAMHSVMFYAPFGCCDKPCARPVYTRNAPPEWAHIWGSRVALPQNAVLRSWTFAIALSNFRDFPTGVRLSQSLEE
jgi:hypothetical protein